MNAPLRTVWLVMLTAMLSAVGGCAVVSWFVAQFAPPQKVKALYKPPKGKTLLVFVDDLGQEVTYAPIKGKLTEKLNKLLVAKGVAGQTVDYDRLVDLSIAASDFNRLAVCEVGQKLGADIVLYVWIDKFSLKDTEASPLWRGQFGTTVRLVDTEAGRLWPQDRLGYPVKPVETPRIDNASPTYGTELVDILAERMADRITKLFHDHRVPAQQFNATER
ncbi:MAG: hypothetical protein SVT52_02445 [Planctomycetota bacterium]|nr:hypothetical protein [Planctomycetota bacterium]